MINILKSKNQLGHSSRLFSLSTIATYALITLAGCGSKTDFASKSGVVKPAVGSNVEAGQKEELKPEGENEKTSRTNITKTFDSATKAKFSSTMNLTANEISTQIEMKNSFVDSTLSFNQVNRPFYSEPFQQGTIGTTRTETFNQNSAKAGPLDILIVVDNSFSMEQEQNKIATQLQPLLSSIQNADWQIKVVTTDPADGCQRALIRKGDANASASFVAALKPGVNGDGNEQGILMSVAGLSGAFPANFTERKGPCPASAAWLRPNSPVVVLIISDEDNCSHGTGCGNKEWGKDKFLKDYLATIRRPGIDAKVYGIIYHPSQTAATCSSGYFKGNQYANIIQETNGLWGSVCTNDYTATMNQISLDAATLLKNQYTLADRPDASGRRVLINDVAVTTGWNVQGNVLTFTTAPQAGSVIKISYTVGARPFVSQYPLSALPAPETLKVLVNGTPVPASQYSVNAATQKLNFNPAEGVSFRVEYKASLPSLLKSFDLGAGVKPGTVTAKVNGVTVSNFAMDNVSRIATMATPPADTAVIVFTFKKLHAKILEYPFAIPAGIQTSQITIKDHVTNAVVPAQFSGGKIIFTNEHHVAGRIIKVAYKLMPVAAGINIPLTLAPIAGSMAITFGSSSACPSESFSYTANNLNFRCDTRGQTEIKVTYDYMQPSLSEASIEEASEPDSAQWSVFFNDVQVAENVEFKRTGNKLQFLTAHGVDTKIKVLVNYVRD